jgi:hypothetical protein
LITAIVINNAVDIVVIVDRTETGIIRTQRTVVVEETGQRLIIVAAIVGHLSDAHSSCARVPSRLDNSHKSAHRTERRPPVNIEAHDRLTGVRTS